MYSQDLVKKVQAARKRGHSWNELQRLFQLPKSTCRNFIIQEGRSRNIQRGNNLKVRGDVQKRLKLAVQRLTKAGERITAPKLLSRTTVDVSISTVQRFLRREGLKYTNPQTRILLSAAHKAKRHEMCQKWLTAGEASRNIVFTDEARFSLDGPDCIKSWQSAHRRKIRPMRQQGGGGVMIWGMLFPSGHLHLQEVKGNLDSRKYCLLPSHFPVCERNTTVISSCNRTTLPRTYQRQHNSSSKREASASWNGLPKAPTLTSSKIVGRF